MKVWRAPMGARLRLCLTMMPIVVPIGAHAQPALARASVRLSIRILDHDTRAPLAAAEILVTRASDTVSRGRSDSLGAFMTSVAPGQTLLIAMRRLGYLPSSIQWTPQAGDTTVLVTMTAAPQALTPVLVLEREPSAPRLTGFDARAQTKSGGSYILREQIDEWHPRRTSDLMRRILGVRLIDSSGVMLAASTRGPKINLKSANAAASWAPCVMRVGVDGQIKEWGFAMDYVDPNDIHGIEVYNGPASIPSEFSGMRTDSFCGLVMIWTRSGR